MQLEGGRHGGIVEDETEVLQEARQPQHRALILGMGRGWVKGNERRVEIAILRVIGDEQRHQAIGREGKDSGLGAGCSAKGCLAGERQGQPDPLSDRGGEQDVIRTGIDRLLSRD